MVTSDWLTPTGIVAATGGLLWLGALHTRVENVEEELDKRATKEELNGLKGLTEEIHKDVREIRRRLES